MAETGHQIAVAATGNNVAVQVDPAGYERQIMVVGDQTATQARVFAAGQQRIAHDPAQLFLDTFDTSLDTVNRWAAPVASGTGAIAATWSAGAILLTGGTASGAYSELHTQAVFMSDEPGWDLYTFRLTLEFPVLTTAYRFWGIGQTTGTPTVAAPLTDACGWEVATSGKMYAVTWQSGTRIPIQDLSSSGNSTQPGDALAHKYFLYFRGDQSYWAIDNPDNLVASFSTGASGPNVNALPAKMLIVSNSGTAATILADAVSMGDTSGAATQISDGTYPWRQATVAATGALAVAPPPSSAAAETGVAASASSVSVLAANTLRKGAAISNDQASATLYLRLSSSAATAASGGYTVILPGGAYYELPFGYTGAVTGIWSSATGFANVSELT
jgi:hypothetical protein